MKNFTFLLEEGECNTREKTKIGTAKAKTMWLRHEWRFVEKYPKVYENLSTVSVDICPFLFFPRNEQ